MISLVQFSLLVILGGYLFDRYIVEVLPVGFSALILILYILAFFQQLQMIEVVLLVSLLAMGIILKRKQTTTHDIARYVKDQLKSPGTYCLFILFLILSVSLMHRRVQELDDYKYWAAAVKSLLARGGYETTNHLFIVSYGDYPQGLPLILWWFEHILGSWHENILYMGFMYFAMSFLLPMTRNIWIENRIIRICFCTVVSFLLYAISTSYTRFGISLEPDRVMALIYAGALTSIVDDKEDVFTYVRLSLYMTAVILMKSIGFVWAFAAFFLYLALRKAKKKRFTKWDFAVAVVPLIVLVSWNVFCLYTKRRAYLTQNMFDAFQGGWLRELQSRSFIIRIFLRNLFVEPLNCASTVLKTTFGINLSPVGFLAVYAVLAIFIGIKKICSSAELKTMVIYSFLTGFFYHIILLWGYLFMFYNEFSEIKYLHMQNLTSHYAGPFYIGTLILFLEIILNKGKPEGCLKSRECDRDTLKKKNKKAWITRYVFFAVIMAALPNYPLTYRYLAEYQKPEIEKSNLEARSKYTEILAPFTDAVKNIPDQLNSQVCFLTTANNGILRSYLHYFTSPLSVLDIYTDEIEMDDLAEQLMIAGSDYFFIFDSFDQTQTEKLRNLGLHVNTLYQVDWTDGKMCFIALGT
ncbi:MAG: hypothetical protein HFI38_14080 [Lachnospiraceae bacterium]|nr:hypothetical protein [Lachnospiraceae bacterium]